MKIEVTTKASEKYIVELNEVWQWIKLERDLGMTYTEIVEAVDKGSLDVSLQVIFSLAKDQNKTEIKTLKAWIQNEYANFDWQDDQDPKDLTGAGLNTEP